MPRKDKATGDPMSRALTILSRGQVTTRRLADKLCGRGFTPEVVESVVARLTQMGYLNDEDLARQWVEGRLNSRPCGRMLLKKELYSKGVGREVVERVLDSDERDGTETGAAVAAAERWLSRAGDRYDDNEVAVKLAAHLKSRGFDFETIRRVVRKATGTDTE